MAPDAEQDRHVMSQTSCECRYLPGRMRWLNAGSDPSRSDRGHQRAERRLRGSDTMPRSLLYAPDLASAPLRSFHPTCVTSIINVDADIKSP
jgi:hypothetical protein